MTRTYRKGEQIKVRSKKNMKKSTKKLRKLEAKDNWDIPNHDKHGRSVG